MGVRHDTGEFRRAEPLQASEVNKRAEAGIFAYLSQRGLAFCVSLASSVVLARLLPPAEFGLAAMATVLFSFVTILRSFGLTSVAIQRETITQEQVSLLFWINLAVTCTLALAVFLAAPIVASFFGEPRVQALVTAMCLPLVVGGASAQFNALLRRELKFSSVVRSEALGLVSGFLAGVAVAAVRHDAWAIITASSTHSIVTAVANVRAARWRPGRPRWMPGTRHLFSFGLNLTIYSLLSVLSANIAPILIGKLQGSIELGYYNRAYQMFVLPGTALITPIMAVMMPVLSRLRSNQDAFRLAYLTLLERLSLPLVSGSAALFFMAPSLTRLLLGPNWEVAGEVLRWLAPALAALNVTSVVQPILTSQGRSRELVGWGFVEAAVRIIGTALGLPWGAVGAAAGFSAATLVLVPAAAWLVRREGAISYSDQAGAITVSLPMTLGIIVACVAASLLWPQADQKSLLAVLVFGFAVLSGAGAGVLLSARSRSALIRMFGAILPAKN